MIGVHGVRKIKLRQGKNNKQKKRTENASWEKLEI